MGLIIVERSFEHPPSDAELCYGCPTDGALQGNPFDHLEAECSVERPAARNL